MTYKQAYDKIIDAYFKDEIEPMDTAFCFCGTLACSRSWGDINYKFVRKEHNYSRSQYRRIEKALMVELGAAPSGFSWLPGTEKRHDDDYEDRLFNGMCAALDVLKQIHIDRGEVIDPLPTFTKRVFSDQIKVKI